MPISRKRKNHREKVLQYRERVASEKKKAQEVLMKMYQEQMQQQKLKEQVNGVDVENTDVNIDLDGMEIITDEVPVTDTAIDITDEVSVTDIAIEESAIDITDTVIEEPIVEKVKPKKTAKKSSIKKN
jgi:DNA-binding transcriptional regulator YbjK